MGKQREKERNVERESERCKNACTTLEDSANSPHLPPLFYFNFKTPSKNRKLPSKNSPHPRNCPCFDTRVSIGCVQSLITRMNPTATGEASKK